MIINKKKSTSKIAKSRGFTLIEMLVVIAILGTLAAIAFPLTKSVLNKGKVTETNMRMKELESAINNFNEENGHLPHTGDYPTNDTVSNTQLTEIVEILLNMESGNDPVNIKGKKYLLMQDAKNNRNGVVYTDQNKTSIEGIKDAWGNEFTVSIDYDLDGEISAASNTTIENYSAIITSKGIDGDLNTEDDLQSWK